MIRAMPRLSAFYGIVVTMYWEAGGQHQAPHFHARHGGRDVSIRLDDFTVLAGSLAPRALDLVLEWAALHADELRSDWERVKKRQPLVPIDPLP